MKKMCLMLAMVMVFSLACVGTAKAALLNFELALPDIFSDSTGTFSYNATTNLFTSTATALTITFDGTTLVNIDNGSYLAKFYVDESGNYTGGVAGADLLITGDIDIDGDSVYDLTGTLIAGEVDKFGWFDTGTSFDLFNYTFDFTSGALASYYAAYQNLGGDAMSSETSSFTGSFLVNFGSGALGKTKHDTAPITPEPTSMVLLGSGLLGLVAAGMRKKKQIA
ncbi:MAG: PEP-CTERM sorting domain-containing protein [Candidatus Omnitrophota bacterium]